MERRPKRLPPWLRKRLPGQEELRGVEDALERLNLATVCREARCPNLCECFARGTATFMILGRVCSRNCAFCAVGDGSPETVDADEPDRVARAAAELGLRHVVITSVTRDDLPDGGSMQFAACVEAVHRLGDVSVEVLTPDFQGVERDIDRVIGSHPDIYNHNVETVPRLYSQVRPQADYRRSLGVLSMASEGGLVTKSGMMLGLGESECEILSVMEDLLEAGCNALTLGQYLQPSGAHYPVHEYITPERFDYLGGKASELGFSGVSSAPFVRSSYNAGILAERIL